MKKLSALLVIGGLLGIVGHMLNLFLVRPAVDGDSLSRQLNVVLINLVLVPSIVAIAIVLVKSLQTKKYPLVIMSTLTLLIIAAMTWYFSYPILHPPVGL